MKTESEIKAEIKKISTELNDIADMGKKFGLSSQMIQYKAGLESKSTSLEMVLND